MIASALVVIIAALPPLTEWESFYVIVGSSAAALTGLMFVVIALLSEARVQDPTALRAFATPTVVHFCAVIVIAAFMSTPRQTAGTLAVCFGITGIIGVVYATVVILRVRRSEHYRADVEDWLWHGTLPALAYVLVVMSAILLGRSESALYVTGAAALLLLFIGIHNAWDSAVWLMTNRKEP